MCMYCAIVTKEISNDALLNFLQSYQFSSHSVFVKNLIYLGRWSMWFSRAAENYFFLSRKILAIDFLNVRDQNHDFLNPGK